MEKRLFLDRICTERRYISVNHGVKRTVYVPSGFAETESVGRYLTEPLTDAAPDLSLPQLFIEQGLFDPRVGWVSRFLQKSHANKIQDSYPGVKQGVACCFTGNGGLLEIPWALSLDGTGRQPGDDTTLEGQNHEDQWRGGNEGRGCNFSPRHRMFSLKEGNPHGHGLFERVGDD